MVKDLRQELEEHEATILSPYAALNIHTRGRLYPEPECEIRLPFQRDRDRIIHCKSFRRLTYKTQVFLAPIGDHYRNRLTHALEVSQIARTVALALKLNGHLTEAIALGHDVGHTPFGHAGESALNSVHPGGFRHYEQSLRVVNYLEKGGKGLNLTAEVRDGILKHSKGRDQILPADTSELPGTLEGRIVRVADIIAYVNHDLDDSIRAEIIKESDVPAEVIDIIGTTHSKRVGNMVRDLIVNTTRTGGAKLSMSSEMMDSINHLRSFLYDNVYWVDQVNKEFVKAKKIIEDLYNYYLENDTSLEGLDIYTHEKSRHQIVCDFIAGMTDRYALDLYQRIFFPNPWKVV